VIEAKHPKLIEVQHKHKSGKNQQNFDPFKIAAESDEEDKEDSFLLNSQSSVFKLESLKDIKISKPKNKVKDLKDLYKEIFF